MDVILMRHGHAISDLSVPVDEWRWLTAAGRRNIQKIGALIHRDGAVSRIVASPLVRAVQTAELIAAANPTAQKVEIDAALTPRGLNRERLMGILSESTNETRVVLVSHYPKIGDVAAELLGRAPRGGFTPGTAVCFRYSDQSNHPFLWRLDGESLDFDKQL